MHVNLGKSRHVLLHKGHVMPMNGGALMRRSCGYGLNYNGIPLTGSNLARHFGVVGRDMVGVAGAGQRQMMQGQGLKNRKPLSFRK